MTKVELRKALDSDLIRESIRIYGAIARNTAWSRPIIRLNDQWNNICVEMLKRGLIVPEDIDRLTM